MVSKGRNSMPRSQKTKRKWPYILVALVIALLVIGVFWFIKSNNDQDKRSSQESTPQTEQTSKKKTKHNRSSESSSTSSVETSSTTNASEASSTADSSVAENSNDSSAATSSSEKPSQTSQTSSNKPASSSSTEPQVGTQTTHPQGAWVAHFERKLYDGYQVTPKYYRYYGNGLWEVWVNEINTEGYPYVTVNQYNGNFHG